MRVPAKYASIERRDIKPGDRLDEAEIVEIAQPLAGNSDKLLRVRIDTVPEDTIAITPDDAAAKAIAIQQLSNNGEHQLGFKVEYWV